MLTYDKACEIRKAIWNDGSEFSEMHDEWCANVGVTPDEVDQFLDGALAYHKRAEQDWREAHAVALDVTIETNQQKKDGSVVLAVALRGVVTPELMGQLFLMRGKPLRARLYDPQEELPLEYENTRPVVPDQQLPFGGLLPQEANDVEVYDMEEES